MDNLRMDKIKKPRLYCFSPAVMLATLTIEIILAIYTFWKYKLNAVTKIVIMLLICLALFQWAEYNVWKVRLFWIISAGLNLVILQLLCFRLWAFI